MTLIVFSTAISAEEKDRPKEMHDKPEGITVTSDNVDDLEFEQHGGYKCFAPDEYKVLANIIIDYRWFWTYSIKRDAIIANYELQIGKYQSQISLWKTMSQKQENSLNFTQALVTEQNKLKLKTNRDQKLVLYATIGIAVLEAVVIGALAFKK